MNEAAQQLTKIQLQERLALVRADQLVGEDGDPSLPPMNADERAAFVSRIATAYPDIERILTRAFRQQLEELGMRAVGDSDIYIARGGLNMADVLLERFRSYRDEHLENLKPEQPDSESPVPTLERG